MRLPTLFTDHMVLQRDCPLPVWGWAKPGEAVTVELAGQTAKATAGTDGRWQVRLKALAAGGPHQLVARGAAAAAVVTVKDILVGEVWVCSGQSNMEWPLSMTHEADTAITGAELPQVRLYTVPKRTDVEPAEHIEAIWENCTPVSAGGFSGVAFYFGRELQQRLKVPVGLINTSWGGTPAQAWTSREGLSVEPALAGYIEELAAFELPAEEVRRRNEKQRAEFMAKLPQDAGNRGVKEGWADLEFNDAAWPVMKLPEYWINAGHATNGVFWFRKTIDVPAAWAGKSLLLSLGAVDKSDDTYVNGKRVGGITWAQNPQSWATPRRYTIPAGVLKAGKNVIAVRAVSNYTGGGMVGPGGLMFLEAPQDSAEASITLYGAWHYSIEQDYGRVTGIAEPASLLGANSPTLLYNGMIAPLIPYAIRGAIWYQGESNAADAVRYRTLFPAMIRDWRKQWQQGDFAFHFVQLANYQHQPPVQESDNSRWAELREAQMMALKLSNTGMAVAIDIGEPRDIHPRNKKDVGIRLALNALALNHQLPVAYRGPNYRAHKVVGSTLRIELANAEGLRSATGPVRGFGLAGADKVFYAAEATLDGTTVVLTSPQVKTPVAARYGWADCPVCSLQNAAGLPAEPFRTDDWPVGPVLKVVKPA